MAGDGDVENSARRDRPGHAHRSEAFRPGDAVALGQHAVTAADLRVEVALKRRIT